MASAIDEYIETLKRLTKTETDSELAAWLGKAKQTVSSWRRRGKVPYELQYELADRFGPEAALYKEVKYATTSRERQAIVTVWLKLFDRYRSHRDPANDASAYISWAQAMLHCELDIRDAVRSVGFLDEGDNQMTVAEVVLVLINTGKLPAVNRAIDVFYLGIDPDTGKPDPN